MNKPKTRTYLRDPKGRTATIYAIGQRKLYAWPATVKSVLIREQRRDTTETWESAHVRGAITWIAYLADGTHVTARNLRILARTLEAPAIAPPAKPAPKVAAPKVAAPKVAPVADPLAGADELAALVQLGRECGIVSFRDLLALKRTLGA